MSDPVHDLVAALHQSPSKYVVSLTGGGSGLAGRLLSVPGGSRTVLEVVVPYAEEALVEYLGARPASFCAAETSRLMARRARERARWLVPGSPVAGLGCTASLRSDRPKRGDQRLHVSVETALEIRTFSLTLTKEARTRAEEEVIVELVALNALAEALGLAARVPIPLLPSEAITSEIVPATDPFAALLVGRLTALRAEPDGRFRIDAPSPKLLLSGSFNPLHEGHDELVHTAAKYLNTEAAFELTILNADKPPLEGEEVRRRLAQFNWRAPVWLTRAPTFVEKARLFPGAAFVVGADTASRVVEPRFYDDQVERMDLALNEFRDRGCRFLVAGRLDASGRFIGLDQLAIPERHRGLFTPLSFRCDISSTQLRKGYAGVGISPTPSSKLL